MFVDHHCYSHLSAGFAAILQWTNPVSVIFQSFHRTSLLHLRLRVLPFAARRPTIEWYAKERHLACRIQFASSVWPCSRPGWFLCICKLGATGLLGLVLACSSRPLPPVSPLACSILSSLPSFSSDSASFMAWQLVGSRFLTSHA